MPVLLGFLNLCVKGIVTLALARIGPCQKGCLFWKRMGWKLVPNTIYPLRFDPSCPRCKTVKRLQYCKSKYRLYNVSWPRVLVDRASFLLGLGRFVKKRFRLRLRFLFIKRFGIPDSAEIPTLMRNNRIIFNNCYVSKSILMKSHMFLLSL